VSFSLVQLLERLLDTFLFLDSCKKGDVFSLNSLESYFFFTFGTRKA